MVSQDELQKRLRDQALCHDVFLGSGIIDDFAATICTGSTVEVPKAVAEMRRLYHAWCEQYAAPGS